MPCNRNITIHCEVLFVYGLHLSLICTLMQELLMMKVHTKIFKAVYFILMLLMSIIGISLLRPMYYEYPEEDKAYGNITQVFFLYTSMITIMRDILNCQFYYYVL